MRRQHAGGLVPLRRQRSVRHKGRREYGTRCEIKNVNSSGSSSARSTTKSAPDRADRAAAASCRRQLYDRPRRNALDAHKEEANDYRYFPDPDLLPLVDRDAFIEGVRKTLPDFPTPRTARFAREHGLSEYDAGVVTASREMPTTTARRRGAPRPKLAANWVMGELSGFLNREGLEIDDRRSARRTRGPDRACRRRNHFRKIAKDVFEAMWSERADADSIIAAKGLRQITDTGAIERAITEVMTANPAHSRITVRARKALRLLRRPCDEGDRREGLRRKSTSC